MSIRHWYEHTRLCRVYEFSRREDAQAFAKYWGGSYQCDWEDHYLAVLAL